MSPKQIVGYSLHPRTFTLKQSNITSAESVVLVVLYRILSNIMTLSSDVKDFPALFAVLQQRHTCSLVCQVLIS